MRQLRSIVFLAAVAFVVGCGENNHPGLPSPKPKPAAIRTTKPEGDEDWANTPNEGNAALVPVDALRSAEKFELISLVAVEHESDENSLYGWPVLGETEVKDDETREDLISALVASARENQGEQSDCFCPRHAIRVTEKGQVTELLICFSCSSAQIYIGGVRSSEFLVSKSQASIFNKVLTDAGVPLDSGPCD